MMTLKDFQIIFVGLTLMWICANVVQPFLAIPEQSDVAFLNMLPRSRILSALPLAFVEANLGLGKYQVVRILEGVHFDRSNDFFGGKLISFHVVPKMHPLNEHGPNYFAWPRVIIGNKRVPSANEEDHNDVDTTNEASLHEKLVRCHADNDNEMMEMADDGKVDKP
ncbi:hypothetical protein VNO78_27048 [Psophocarpus tetragonolobus]|uniref:Uncharacterized protein n=1 Tax=Psophocarpus tetragonolobus TaxID=3891 RepID=A0AAN9X9E1_PSOTE